MSLISLVINVRMLILIWQPTTASTDICIAQKNNQNYASRISWLLSWSNEQSNLLRLFFAEVESSGRIVEFLGHIYTCNLYALHTHREARVQRRRHITYTSSHPNGFQLRSRIFFDFFSRAKINSISNTETDGMWGG